MLDTWNRKNWRSGHFVFDDIIAIFICALGLQRSIGAIFGVMLMIAVSAHWDTSTGFVGYHIQIIRVFQ